MPAAVWVAEGPANLNLVGDFCRGPSRELAGWWWPILLAVGGDTAGCLLGICESGHRSELGELSEVLGSSSEQELVAGAAWSAQSEASEPEDAPEVSEQRLDLLAPVP